MPGKSFQSKLEPFYDFIRECRSKRWSYARIAEALTQQHSLKVSTNTVFSFVKVRAKGRKLYALPSRERASAEKQVSPDMRRKANEFFKTETSNHTDHEHRPKKTYNLDL